MFTLDRFEGDSVIIEATDENGEITMVKTDIGNLSPEVSEGDVLICENGIYITDTEATIQRKKQIYERLRKFRN